jgi:hypothetical protein
MKKLVFFFSCFMLVSLGSIAQCNPLDHDWMGVTYGVSPDPTIGENFVSGIVGQPYEDVVYVLSPSDAGQIDSAYIGIGIVIDSIHLDSIVFFDGLIWRQTADMGLTVSCNNNGDASDACMFLAAHPYCGDISGIPTMAGDFPVRIYIKAYFFLFGNQQYPTFYEGYTLSILPEGSISVNEVASGLSLTSLQNTPNPTSDFTNVTFDLNVASNVKLEVMNLVGDKVLTRNFLGKRGVNTFKIDTSDIQQGIYLYSIECGNKKLTKRMIIQH